MSATVNVAAIAVEETPFGCGVRFEAGHPQVERDRARVEGLVRRTANTTAAQPGEDLTICTNGGLLGEIEPGQARWEEIRGGRLLDGQA